MKYSDLNFDSIKRLSKKEFVLIPVGCMEVHGPNLPLGSDLYIAEAFAALIGEKVKSIIMPSVSYGYADVTKNIFGTISMDFAVLTAYLCNIIDNLVNSGFEKIVIINIHKDNDLAIKTALTKIFEEKNIPVLYLNPYNDFLKFNDLVFSSKDNSYKETSLILASLELLNKKEVVGELRSPEHKYEKPSFLKNLQDIGYIRYGYNSEMQHINPEKMASVEEGKKYMDMVVDEITGKVNFLEEYASFLKNKGKK
jgi:creatinine amidohydrolase/Fe(II)-dependent formamide hydrolase-like protein